MTKNPFINALVASLYIVIIASIIYYVLKPIGQQDTLIIPIAIISLFTLSAAVMGYLFLSQPLRLYFDGNKKQAVRLFLTTVAIFGCTTGVILIFIFLNTSGL